MKLQTIALVDRDVRRGIDLVDPPVVGLAVGQQAGQVIGGGVLARADQHAPGVGPAGRVDVVEYGPEVHVVRGRILAGLPGHDDITRYVCGLHLGLRT